VQKLLKSVNTDSSLLPPFYGPQCIITLHHMMFCNLTL